MNIDEIRKNKPDGVTHYYEDGVVKITHDEAKKLGANYYIIDDGKT